MRKIAIYILALVAVSCKNDSAIKENNLDSNKLPYNDAPFKGKIGKTYKDSEME